MFEENFDIVITKKNEVFIFIFYNNFKKKNVFFEVDKKLRNIIIYYEYEKSILRNIDKKIIKRIIGISTLKVFEIKNGEIYANYLIEKKPL